MKTFEMIERQLEIMALKREFLEILLLIHNEVKNQEYEKAHALRRQKQKLVEAIEEHYSATVHDLYAVLLTVDTLPQIHDYLTLLKEYNVTELEPTVQHITSDTIRRVKEQMQLLALDQTIQKKAGDSTKNLQLQEQVAYTSFLLNWLI